MLQWYQFDGWICTHRINPFYRGKVKLCKMCKIDYETIQEFLSFSFHYNNMDLLVDRAAEVLKNPIAVFDKNYYTVSYSDTTDVQDEVWTAGKKRGYCLFEYAAMLHGVESMRGTPLPFQIFDDWGPHRRRICPLISNSLTIGYLSVLEYHTAFDAVPGEIYDLVAGVLVKELTIEQAIRLSHQHDSAEMLLSSILNEGFANRALFLQRILGTVFEQAGPYSLIGINMHAFSSRVSGERHFKARLGTIFPKAWSLFFREYVVLLVECGKSRQIPQDGLQQLEGYLSEHDLCAGISDTFSDLYEIRRYFNQAAMAEKMSHMTECEMILHEMDDHAALKDALEESNLLINATSVGMVPDVTGTVIPDKALFHPELTVADVVYEPRETRLLREAREAGCPTFNGMYMLLHQGVKAFHIWTGLDMPVELVREKYFK